MRVSKAVITAAGPGQAQLPLQTLMNRRGAPCSTLSVQLAELADHIYVSDDSERTCASQLIEVARREQCLVSAVQSTHESQLRQFGTIGGALVSGQAGLYEVNQLL